MVVLVVDRDGFDYRSSQKCSTFQGDGLAPPRRGAGDLRQALSSSRSCPRRGDRIVRGLTQGRRHAQREAERDQALERLLGSLAAPAAKGRFHERLWERIDAAEAIPVARPARDRLFRRPRLAAVALGAAAVAVWVAVSRSPALEPGRRGCRRPPPAVAQVIQNVRIRLVSCRSLTRSSPTSGPAPLPSGARLVASDGRVPDAAIARPDGSWRLPP